MSATVLGIDSSTQSCKAVLVDADTGEVRASRKAAHPGGTQVDPRAWVDALEEVTRDLLPHAEAISVAGQQHGLVPLGDGGVVLRKAMLWNDTSSAQAAAELVEELGGAHKSVELTGSVIGASFTAAKLRHLRDEEPEVAKKITTAVLPHDFLTANLAGTKEKGGFSTDDGDASGTGYYSPKSRRFIPEIAELAVGHDISLPRIAQPGEVVGKTSTGALIAAGTGDNMAAALGLGLHSGEMVVSLGTSGVVSTPVRQPVMDETGLVNGFSDATGAYLPLSCTLNCARVLDFTAGLLGVDHEELSRLALAAETQATTGVTFLPYLDGERTPDRPTATGVIEGLTTRTTREDVAHAAVVGVLCSLADAVAALTAATGVVPSTLTLVGGAARSPALQHLAPRVFGMPVEVVAEGEYVALGAARQAAWALSGADNPPQWPAASVTTVTGEEDPDFLTRHRSLRDRTQSW